MFPSKLILIITFLTIISPKEPNKDLIPFTATHLHKLNRISGYVITTDNLHVVYVNRQWKEETGKFITNLKYINLKTEEKGDLTEPSYNYSDMNPVVSKEFPHTIFFLRSTEGRVHIYTININLPEHSEAIKFSDYPLDISNMIITGNTIVFSAEMFYSCEDMSCSAKKFKEISDRGPNSYSIYTELMIRHWDHWYTEGSASHVFYQKIKNVDNMPVLDGNPVDMINKQNLCSPPIEYGSEQFDISSNEKYIAFSVHRKDRNMSWTTKWDILLYDVDNKNYINVTTEVLGRAQNPKFSPDSTKLAYFYMKRSGLESDILRMQIFDISQQKTIPPKFLNEPKQFPQDFIWSDEKNNLLIYTTLEAGRHILYEYSYNDDTYKQLTSSTDNNSYGIPKKIDVNKYFIDYSSHKFPTVFGILEKKTESDFYESTIFFDPNKEDLLNYEMIDPEYFTYKGVNDDEIQGWLLKPINFDEKKKYPLAFLIHGGPEGSWDTSWSYRWNPQLFANRGYAVVTINPHGSSGMGIEFQDAVRNDWGGAPFKDLMLGWNYVKEKYKWIDMDRVGGCGASYGGYMVNWIQGNNDDKKFKCLVTHDGVFSTVTMFYATEEMWFPLSEYCPHDKWGCTPFNSEEERIGYEKFSPESRVDHWNTPHLIIHGSKDYRIPITEGISAFTALQIRGIESRFLHFPDENHWVLKPENSIKWYDEVLGWLDKFLDNN